MNSEPDRLGPGAAKLVADTTNELFLPAGSSWETAIKRALGRLPAAGKSLNPEAGLFAICVNHGSGCGGVM